MGIPKFYSQFLTKSSNFTNVFSRGLPPLISSLSIDANALIHSSAALVYNYGSEKTEARQQYIEQTSAFQLEQELFETFGNKLLSLLTFTHPTDTFVIAIDGSAIQAKQAQQRTRRFRNAQMRKGSKVIFDSNSITPGTDFMYRLDAYILKWLDANKPNFPSKIIYSSHLQYGEGEHKILDFMRSGAIPQGINNGVHILHGMDSDLVLLSLISPLHSVYLWREDINNVLNIEEMKLSLIQRFQTPEPINDFVFLISFLGNDFIPHHPVLEDYTTVIDEMIDIYRNNYQNDQQPLILNNEINWEGLASFLKVLAEREPQMMKKESEKAFTFPSRMISAATQISTITTTTPGARGLNATTIKNFSFEIFRNSWYSNEFLPRGLTPNMQETFSKLGITVESTVTIDKVVGMCVEYLTALAWTFAYYTKGIAFIDLRWYYPYYHSPLFTDLYAVLVNQRANQPNWIPDYQRKEGQAMLNVIHQLLSVLPPASFNLLPVEVLPLTKWPNLLTAIYPIDFIYELDGKMVDWQGVSILPFVDPEKVIRAVATIPFSPERALHFSPSAVVEMLIDANLVALLKSKRAFEEFSATQSARGSVARGRGRGLRGDFRGRGRGSERGSSRGRGTRGRGDFRTSRGGFSNTPVPTSEKLPDFEIVDLSKQISNVEISSEASGLRPTKSQTSQIRETSKTSQIRETAKPLRVTSPTFTPQSQSRLPAQLPPVSQPQSRPSPSAPAEVSVAALPSFLPTRQQIATPSRKTTVPSAEEYAKRIYNIN